MKRNRILFSLLVLLLCFLSVYACALAYLIALRPSLPRTDWAYGYSLSQTLSDPFAHSIALRGAIIGGLVAFPITLFCLWRRDLLRCGLIIFGGTFLYIVSATAIAPAIGLFGCPLIALALLFFCRFTRLSLFKTHGESSNVA